MSLGHSDDLLGMLLPHLVSEVLEQIFSYVGPIDVLSLLVACKPLRSLLQSRIELNLRISGHEDSHGQLPRAFLTLGKLRSIYLFRYWTESNIPSQNGLRHPFAFGSHLKSLQVRGYGAFTAFLDRTTCSFEPSSPLAMPTTTYWSTHSLGAVMPNLELFKVWDPTQQQVFIALPDSLPPSLTILSIKLGFHRDKGLTNIHNLERLTQLTHLSLTSMASKFDATSLLASLPYLTRANIQSLSPATFINDQMTHIHLPSLTEKWTERLTSSCTRLTTRILTLDELPMLQQLRNVTRLRLDSDHGENLFRALPPALVELRVQEVLVPPNGCPWFFCFLPHTLLRFITGRQIALGDAQVLKQHLAAVNKSLWLPAGLRLLSLYSRDPIPTKDWLPLFPRSLTILRLDWTMQASESDTTFDFASHFSQLLLGFTLRPDASRTAYALPIAAAVTLPPLVKIVRLRAPLPNALLPALEAARVSLLDVVLKGGGWSTKLETLDIDDTVYPTVEAIKALPATLKTFSICKKSSVYGIRQYPGGITLREYVPPAFISALSYLPPALTSLTIDDSWLIEDPEPLLRSLPATLKLLTLEPIRNFDDQHVPLLPPRLERLTISYAHNLSDTAMDLLPDTIEALELRLNRALTINAIKLVPPSIRSITLPKNVNFKRAQRHEIHAIMLERGLKLGLETKKLSIQ